MTANRPRTALTIALLAVALLTGALRGLHNARLRPEPRPTEAGRWWTTDPDSHYHMRRLLRLLDEGAPVAETDAYLNHPEGSAIPWPPYYTYVLAACLGPFAPEEPEARRLFVEHGVGSLPALFAALTAVAAALAAARLAGRTAAAVVAGAQLAFFNGSIQYSAISVGDHHAFVSCVTAWMFLAVAEALARERSARGGLVLGAGAGLLAGLLLGSWVGGLMYVVLVQAALGLALCAHARAPRPALAPFGLAFHVVALVVLLPAVLSSPWRADEPWMVVNLSWFHPAQLAVAALVFVPPLALPAGSLVARRYPWIVGIALAAAAGLLAVLDVGPAAGIRAGFEWAGRTNEFMGYINESQPLLGPDGRDAAQLVRYLGLGVFVLPLAWGWALVRALRSRDARFLVWLVAAPVLLFQALVQRRFADGLGAPMAVLIGFAAAALVGLDRPAAVGFGRLPAVARVAVGVLLAAALNPAIARNSVALVTSGQRFARGPGAQFQRALRAELEWLRARPDEPPGAVLAQWERGHTIEWCADRPSVGTNFGIYVGREGYLAPWQFLLAEDPAAAEAILVARDAPFVLVTAQLSRNVPTMLRILSPTEESDYYARSPEGAFFRERWYGTMAARLQFLGARVEPRDLQQVGPSLDFLRLVHVTDHFVSEHFITHAPGPSPAAMLWERVRGAQLEALGEPGQTLTVEVDLAADFADGELGFRWSSEAPVGEDGRAVLRVPYATDAPNGIVVAVGRARWRIGDRSGRTAISESAVRAGAAVALE